MTVECFLECIPTIGNLNHGHKTTKKYDKFKTQTNFYGLSMTRMIAYQHNVHDHIMK
jgi:hypothetical protein